MTTYTRLLVCSGMILLGVICMHHACPSLRLAPMPKAGSIYKSDVHNHNGHSCPIDIVTYIGVCIQLSIYPTVTSCVCTEELHYIIVPYIFVQRKYVWCMHHARQQFHCMCGTLSPRSPYPVCTYHVYILQC